MNLKNGKSIPKHKKYFKEINSTDINNKYLKNHDFKYKNNKNNILDSNETSSSTGHYISKQNSFNFYKSNEILKKIKIKKFEKYFGDKKTPTDKKTKKEIYFSDSKKLKIPKPNSYKNILINDSYNINTVKKELLNFSNRYNSNSKNKNIKLYHKKILKKNTNKNLKSSRNNKINLNSIKINNISNCDSNSKAKIHFYKNKSNYLNNKMNISDINDDISENDTVDNLGVNSVKTNDYKVNKPKEMNLKYKFFKNYLKDEEEIINISHISKIFIGEINEYKDIIEDDKNFSFSFTDKYDTIHQSSKSLYSKNLIEDLNKIYNLLDQALPEEKEENVDDEKKPKYHKSRNSQKYIKLINNTVQNSNKKRMNSVYSKKKVKSKSKVINKKKKMSLPQRARRPHFLDLDKKKFNKNESLTYANSEKCFIF